MKIVLLWVIRVYWVLIPKSKRRKCLFKTTCSNYVYKTTTEEGLISGLKSLKFRIHNCNSHYSILKLDDKQFLITKTNRVFKEKEISNSILN